MALSNEDLQAIASLLQPMNDEIQMIKGELQSVKGELQWVKGELQSVKGEVQSIKEEVQLVKDDQIKLKNDLEMQIKHSECVLKNEIRQSEELILSEVERVHHILDRHKADKTVHTA